MKFTLITVGKMKDDGGFKEMAKFYEKRIKIYSSISFTELKEKKSVEIETENILKLIPDHSYLIALRENGKKFNTVQFSKLLQKQELSSKDITFVIGGAYGLGNINEDLSLSIAPWTLPHQLAKIVLMEQIYRALSFHNGSKYHHS